MYGRSLDELGYLFSQPNFIGFHRGSGKGHEITLRVVDDTDFTGQVARTRILPANTHIG